MPRDFFFDFERRHTNALGFKLRPCTRFYLIRTDLENLLAEELRAADQHKMIAANAPSDVEHDCRGDSASAARCDDRRTFFGHAGSWRAVRGIFDGDGCRYPVNATENSELDVVAEKGCEYLLPEGWIKSFASHVHESHSGLLPLACQRLGQASHRTACDQWSMSAGKSETATHPGNTQKEATFVVPEFGPGARRYKAADRCAPGFIGIEFFAPEPDEIH